MTKRLIDLDLTRIDRVGKGSNPGSRIVLWKSVNKTQVEDLLAQAAAALREIPKFSWVEGLDADTDVAVFRDFDGARLGQQLKRKGDSFELDGEPFPVVIEFRPLSKSAPVGSEEGEAVVPVNKEDLDADVLAFVEEIEKERDNAKAETVDALAKVAELTEPGPDVDADEFMKSAPESIRKALEDAETARAEVATMRDDAETVRFREIAKADLGHTGDKAGEVGSVLKSVAVSCGEDSDDYKTLLQTLKAAAAQSEKAMEQLGRQAGTNGVQFDGESVEQVVSLAKAYQLEHGVTYSAALTAVSKENAALIADIEQARVTRAGK